MFAANDTYWNQFSSYLRCCVGLLFYYQSEMLNTIDQVISNVSCAIQRLLVVPIPVLFEYEEQAEV